MMSILIPGDTTEGTVHKIGTVKISHLEGSKTADQQHQIKITLLLNFFSTRRH